MPEEPMLQALMSEANKIKDESIRSFTLQVIKKSPTDSWKLPSSRDHHMKDECGEWGNAIHTLRVIKICDTLADILNLPISDRDILKAAAILHDSCKHGINAEAVFIYKEHPQLVQGLIEKLELEAPSFVMECINQHMGRWGRVNCDWKSGQITLPFLLHAADCIEARTEDIINIKEK